MYATPSPPLQLSTRAWSSPVVCQSVNPHPCFVCSWASAPRPSLPIGICHSEVMLSTVPITINTLQTQAFCGSPTWASPWREFKVQGLVVRGTGLFMFIPSSRILPIESLRTHPQSASKRGGSFWTRCVGLRSYRVAICPLKKIGSNEGIQRWTNWVYTS